MAAQNHEPARARQVSIALQTDKTPARYATLARAAEDLGFDGVRVFADIGFQPPALALATIAAATSRVRIGAACQNPLLTHPVEIAGQVAALDLASGGRAYVGLARGAWLDGLGVDTSRPIARLADSAEIIRRLLAGDDSGYAGDVLGVAPGVRLQFALPARPVDLLVGTWGERTARWASGCAAEVKIGGSANPDMVRVMRRWLGASPTRIVVGAVTVCDTDRCVARSMARREVALYLDVVAGLDPSVTVPPDVRQRIASALQRGDHAGAGAAVPDELLDRFAFAGTPADIASQIDSLF
ncbi:MAG: LLM class flavin-dependent oxidoreductase, partial [Candidatus Dormibacteraeota bacterium]|nr:LLM class flavin-dependent oxidoreductase [Candidatus Dormibacteraeota bacterium]